MGCLQHGQKINPTSWYFVGQNRSNVGKRLPTKMMPKLIAQSKIINYVGSKLMIQSEHAISAWGRLRSLPSTLPASTDVQVVKSGPFPYQNGAYLNSLFRFVLQVPSKIYLVPPLSYEEAIYYKTCLFLFEDILIMEWHLFLSKVTFQHLVLS